MTRGRLAATCLLVLSMSCARTGAGPSLARSVPDADAAFPGPLCIDTSETSKIVDLAWRSGPADETPGSGLVMMPPIGGAGEPAVRECADGQSVIGIAALAGARMGDLMLLCATPTAAEYTVTEPIGGPTGAPFTRLCEVGERVLGFSGGADDSLRWIAPVYGYLEASDDERWAAAFGEDTPLARPLPGIGDEGGEPFVRLCPYGLGVSGMIAEGGGLAFGARFACSTAGGTRPSSPAYRATTTRQERRVRLGAAYVDALPRGAVFAEDTVVGTDTPALVPLPTGRHSLRVVWADGESEEKQVEIGHRTQTVVYFHRP